MSESINKFVYGTCKKCGANTGIFKETGWCTTCSQGSKKKKEK